MARDPMVERDFRDFVVARSVALQRTAYLLTGDWGLAEDLVQTALIKTYLSWHRVGGIAAVEPYARRILVNTATSWWRRRWRGERPTAELPDCGGPDDTDQWLERDRVWQLIRTLPRGQRAVVVLRYYEDLTEVETARLLGVSTGTVKQHATRALASLRKRLGTAGTDDAMAAKGSIR